MNNKYLIERLNRLGIILLYDDNKYPVSFNYTKDLRRKSVIFVKDYKDKIAQITLTEWNTYNSIVTE